MLLLKEILSLVQEDAVDDELKYILRQDYSTFVKKLGSNIRDPKFVQAIRDFAGKLPIATTDVVLPVKSLFPTQNEIVMEKSLSFPLADSATARKYLRGGSIAVADKSIVTSNKRFIIDGHHRWSQLYCINPEAKIKALDLPIKDPMKALKATQIGVATQLKSVPSSPGGGTNLFKATEEVVKKYVKEKIQKSVIQVFKEFGKGDTPEAIGDHIWRNILLMREKNKPVQGAPKRDIMPQTDDAPEFTKTSFHPERVF